MAKQGFVELTVQNHLVSHGFDEENQEILEEVSVAAPMRKLIAVHRIQSVTEKYILTSYGHGRLVYWEYMEPYEAVRVMLLDD